MKIKIIDYRGFEISFDTEKERFYVFSDSYDTEQYKPSFASAKKYIDDFLKENNEFKPFFLESNPCSSFVKKNEKIRIVGIRKDNLFVYEDSKGNKNILSKYDEDDYSLENQENEEIIKTIECLEEQNSINNKLIKEAKSKLSIVTAKDLKDKYANR